eukprot:12932858-Prorocentrum_lima.AAC.1
MARPALLPKNAQNRFHEQGGWNKGTQVEEGETISSRSAVLGPHCQSQTHCKMIQGHAGVHREHKDVQRYCNQMGAAC